MQVQLAKQEYEQTFLINRFSEVMKHTSEMVKIRLHAHITNTFKPLKMMVDHFVKAGSHTCTGYEMQKCS